MIRWRTGVLLAMAFALFGGSHAMAQDPKPSVAGSAPKVDAVAASTSVDATDAVIETLRLGALDMKARHVRPRGSDLSTLLLVHDTLGAYGDPLISALQTALAERGFASLAINLTLGVSDRSAALECNQRHTHRHEDALDEVDAWTDWLLGQGLGPVVLVGHGRGGAQAAWHLARRAGPRIAAGVLLAPTGWTPRQADAEYRARYAAGLAALLTQIAGRAPDEVVENVPFLHCGAVDATKASIESYYGVQPMRDTPTALAETDIPTIALMPEAVVAGDDTARRLEQLDNPAVAVRQIEGANAQFSGPAFEMMLNAFEAYYRSIFVQR